MTHARKLRRLYGIEPEWTIRENPTYIQRVPPQWGPPVHELEIIVPLVGVIRVLVYLESNLWGMKIYMSPLPSVPKKGQMPVE